MCVCVCFFDPIVKAVFDSSKVFNIFGQRMSTKDLKELSETDR